MLSSLELWGLSWELSSYLEFSYIPQSSLDNRPRVLAFGQD